MSDIPEGAVLVEGDMTFVQAKNYTKANRTRIDLIVIHTMEAPEKGTTAESVAAYFAGPNAPQASAHYCIDRDSIVQCVHEKDVAWHAPGANNNGIGLEHAGYASQSAIDWEDPYSADLLARSAILCAEICIRWHIPIQKVSAEELKQPGTRGICGHKDCTDAFSGGKGHWDPGPNFPWNDYIDMVKRSAEMIQGDTALDASLNGGHG